MAILQTRIPLTLAALEEECIWYIDINFLIGLSKRLGDGCDPSVPLQSVKLHTIGTTAET